MILSRKSQACEDTCRVGKSLFDWRYVHAIAGNISVKLDDGFLITPTDACMDLIVFARLAKLDAATRQISGNYASKTIAACARIYSATAPFDTSAGFIIHAYEASKLAACLKTNNLHQVLFNALPGGTDATSIASA